MAIDIETRESPGWWLNRLDKKRQSRLPRLELLARYHEGDPPLPEGAQNAKKAYQAFQKKARLNLAELIVGSLRERQQVRAIRTAVAGESNGDDLAWEIFLANDLDVEFSDVLENMLALGDAYMIVGVNPEVGADEKPTAQDIWITGEDPRQVVTIHDPVRQSVIRAAAKFFHDPEEERDYAYLYLPGRRYVAYSDRKNLRRAVRFSASWDWDETRGGDEGQETGIENEVSVVRFRNRRGIGEFEPHIDVLDRINHMILQRMVIATMQAFKQRAIVGDLPEYYPAGHPKAGEKIDYDEIFESDPGALWLIPAAAELWESGQVDLSGILNSVHDDLKHLAAVTRRPLSIFSPDAATGSAEGASLVREGLTFATEDRNKRAGRALAKVMHLAFLLMGEDQRADLGSIHTDWMPVERYSLAAKGSASIQAKTAGLSRRGILEHIWQMTPDQIDRELANAGDDLLFGFPDDEDLDEESVVVPDGGVGGTET